MIKSSFELKPKTEPINYSEVSQSISRIKL